MQSIGYVEINGEKIKVLMRDKKHSRVFKRRLSGRDGSHMVDEQAFLEQNLCKLTLLKAGMQVEL